MITVIKPGLLSTVQDEGRRGYRAFGMPLTGAMDLEAYAIANLLAGNARGAAALELTLLGVTLRFDVPALVAVHGADMNARLDGAPVRNGSAFQVRVGAELAFGAAAAGARAYLAVRGGIDVPEVLGSRSTYTRAALGGFQGRALRAGDVLKVGEAAERDVAPFTLPAELLPRFEREVPVRVMLGPQDDRFLPEGIQTFLETPYAVSNRNDRMGYQLEGAVIRHRDKADIVSDAICPGGVQVPGRGMPIVLMSDCQTVGGYAKIATVIGPDLRKVAQSRLGDAIRFSACAEADAVRALKAQRTRVAEIAAMIPGGPV